MNCRRFENSVADWLAGRLPADVAQQMAVHRKNCAACARIASEEESLRSHWTAWQAPARTPDLRQRVIDRLSVETARRTLRLSYRWATAAMAVVLVPVAIFVGTEFRTNTASRTSPDTAIPIRLPLTSPQSAVSGLPPGITDSGTVDPSVDDPVGAGMEHVLWTPASMTINR